MKVIKNDRFVIIVALLYFLMGCSGTVQSLRDLDFVVGCKVVEAEVKLGYFNQEGAAVVCKVKCSKNLPEHFSYKYTNARTGCNVEIH